VEGKVTDPADRGGEPLFQGVDEEMSVELPSEIGRPAEGSERHSQLLHHSGKIELVAAGAEAGLHIVGQEIEAVLFSEEVGEISAVLSAA